MINDVVIKISKEYFFDCLSANMHTMKRTHTDNLSGKKYNH